MARQSLRIYFVIVIRFLKSLFSEPEQKKPARQDQFSAIRLKFRDYNKSRLAFLRNNLSPVKRDVFDLIPVLLHENAPDLPGGDIAGKLLHGISCFSISSHHKDLLAKHFPGYGSARTAKPTLAIEFLAVIGSAGTIAFTGQSDIDYWVGIEVQKHSKFSLDLLEEKFREIEKWANKAAGMELHFFVADQHKIRNNDYGEVGGESCGSALAKLLKDEFYRTAILLEGKTPYFWTLPAGINDEQYTSHIARLINTDSFPATDFVDLGNIGTIGKTEYFGAALWQILKGLSSPFKSVLKIGLLDKYTFERENTPPLCDQFKEILLASVDGSRPDPYLFMAESVRLHYTAQHSLGTAKLLEQCFFIKSLLRSGSGYQGKPININAFYAIGKDWGWTKEEIDGFANFSQWDYPKREKLRRQIMEFFISTYKKIRSRTNQMNVHISENDLTVIGRQLTVFFESKENKVPHDMPLLEARDLSGVSIEESHEIKKTPYWTVKARIKGSKDTQLQTLKILDNPIIALFWICLNGLYSRAHLFNLKGQTKWSVTEALNLLQMAYAFFPPTKIGGLRTEDVLANPTVTHLFILPNWEKPSWKFGIGSVLCFTINTWGEMLCLAHKGEDCPQWIARDILLNKVGRRNLDKLKWTVHTPKGLISSGKRLGGNLSKAIERFIASATGQPGQTISH